jgi:mRNA-degrading endonuclease RelE of RelBE toxin-antitoxin system
LPGEHVGKTKYEKSNLEVHTALPYNVVMEFIETSLFTRLIYDYLSKEEYLGLQVYLLRYPDRGAIIPGSGGVRKIRWAISGKGKRGGIRVIYYWKVNEDEIWLLTVYGKSERDTIPGHLLKRIAEEIKNV